MALHEAAGRSDMVDRPGRHPYNLGWQVNDLPACSGLLLSSYGDLTGCGVDDEHPIPRQGVYIPVEIGHAARLTPRAEAVKISGR